MKYLKQFEKYNKKFKLGDFVIIISEYTSIYVGTKFKNGDICKVIDIISDSYGMGSEYILIENENGVIEKYSKDRLKIATQKDIEKYEIKKSTNKYNI